MKKLKAAIIGGGSIGALKPDEFDKFSGFERAPDGEKILTHAHAVMSHPNLELHAIVDPDKGKRNRILNKWECCIASDLKGMKTHLGTADIYYVCVPTQNHARILEEILSHSPKCVVAEKPFCGDFEVAKDIETKYREAGIPLIVDFIRRFDPLHHYVARNLENGFFGNPAKAFLYYGRGLRHEASHAIDLFNWWFGILFSPTAVLDKIIDHFEDDPSYHVIGKWGNVEVQMIPIDSKCYGIFEYTIFTDTHRLTFIKNGAELVVQPALGETVYGHYLSLSSPFHNAPLKGNLYRALYHLADHAYKVALGIEEPLCGSREALKVLKDINNILEK